MNPRGFHLPVFKTGALGRYASPPWERLQDESGNQKIEGALSRKIEEFFDDLGDAIFHVRFCHIFSVNLRIRMTICNCI